MIFNQDNSDLIGALNGCVRFIRKGWDTTITFTLPVGYIALAIFNNSSLALVWNTPEGVLVRSANIPLTIQSNVISQDSPTVSRDVSDITQITLTYWTQAAIMVLIPNV